MKGQFLYFQLVVSFLNLYAYYWLFSFLDFSSNIFIKLNISMQRSHAQIIADRKNKYIFL